MTSLSEAYNALPATHHKHVYLLATSEESQQSEHKTKFCQRANNGAHVAECTNDKMSTDWFKGTTADRYVIWFFRNPADSCKWKYHGRFSTNDMSEVKSNLQQTMLILLGASAACTGGSVPATMAPTTTESKTTTTTAPRVWQQVDANGECDTSAGEQYFDESPGRGSTLEDCKKSCAASSTGCKSITFFKSGYCSHFLTLCKTTKRKRKAKSMRLVAPSSLVTRPSGGVISFVLVAVKVACDTGAGEVYCKQSPGKVGSLNDCQKSCEQNAECRSITFFRSGWCSHYSTPCTKVRKMDKAMCSWQKVIASRQLRRS